MVNLMSQCFTSQIYCFHVEYSYSGLFFLTRYQIQHPPDMQLQVGNISLLLISPLLSSSLWLYVEVLFLWYRCNVN